MAETAAESNQPVEPSGILPEDSVLSLEEYLEMQAAIGNKTRYRILRTLTHNGDLSASDLKETLGLEANSLHYHLDLLVDVGLVQNRKRKEADSAGLYSYYRASALGEGILEHGVEELMRREHEFQERYS
ncbi:helix-turn-helix domain-containing protein [Halococcus sp. IIIV-5B]|uniref:winged helix-turn-helix domain-containing protein n=1 Tax=Halococcus sp. IIIV-5B TaxID=2321230 RepID=UPI000E74F066|nr:helix-turn-helix domain-containing protein [Halococcus sp. IIIV-5B]RJT08040.1 winged helix-turn-helix transcriptional regulator [Halococcus sp. IIIV-5B]